MNVILGVTGCIGAYKSAVILRLLQKEGFDTFPVMTRSAQQFITPLTLEKLSGHPVVSDLFGEHTVQIQHITLARKSDLLLVAPATANILGKFARGIADDFLSTLYLSTTTPVVVAPAMNVEMWHHRATQDNVSILKERGVIFVDPESGYLACGEVGEGRLAEPELVLEAVLNTLCHKKSLRRKKVLVTAGPTVEDLDPVRFLSNRSSGKMGYAIAREAQRRGAEIVLVSGPTHLESPEGVNRILVRSAVDMSKEVLRYFGDSDIVVMAAAVSDFVPSVLASEKIKKGRMDLVLPLDRTPDILANLKEHKTRQFMVGFAAESDHILENAHRKLREKNLDLIVANDISHDDRGFSSDFNEAILLDASGHEEVLPKLAKSELAKILWDRIEYSSNVLSMSTD
ncbi:MAG: bifunctional phosphopantothenoylcysteine decarboxylase/phosphopantothenate--cysteine ligase CoaBC [Acidobacteriota bacterium]|nr:bifunctional phosphopantothenoylcysteine decarboxylase/phosphopantothenate--cysteine ligase CoaBC [Acidobacteriota bacterium]